jgi:hypothetical protein
MRIRALVAVLILLHTSEASGTINSLSVHSPGPKQPLAYTTGKDDFASEAKIQFQAVIFVATANVLINALRPDPYILWPMRLPRILWELSVMAVAKAASQSVSPSCYLMLALMMITTSLVDIFIWAPVFAAFASFESCTGGEGWLWFQQDDPVVCHTDYIQGHGRVLVTIQSMVGGVIYLSTGIVAWNCYKACRDHERVEREVCILDKWERLKATRQ